VLCAVSADGVVCAVCCMLYDGCNVCSMLSSLVLCVVVLYVVCAYYAFYLTQAFSVILNLVNRHGTFYFVIHHCIALGAKIIYMNGLFSQ
jgi:hypothetical protein